ncbi:maltose-binding protein/trehalose-binding protein/sucrose-binding protein [Loktanella fryxellensis]|uniref:Maltose-binding protein/trehalose-binding protein/sucrose-binding protein n=1 Tax=Loktanella fryxellensis TaxID=245187 RepID=A0A1H8G928_9RHOB|nr:ABC transporter substrate-binding protein [Loktanella fryxellensis]SEN40349.1 maltose-binding protein/trehalose-binding protein/sucrose-binding protein [Loktanella fryxellensis]
MIRTLSGVSVLALLAVSASSASAQDLMFPKGEGAFNWDSLQAFADANDLSGEQVTVFGPWLGPDQAAIETVLAYFADATGADVRYTGSDSFEQQVVIDAEAGSSANVAVFPQPGLASDMAARGFLAPLPAEVGAFVAENYAAGQSWVDLGTYAGPDGTEAFYAFPYKADVKSLVWYVPENFEDAGYEVPTTMEEMKALSDQIVADGGKPWCIGLGSGGATGWPATDWVEDLMLRMQTPENYDAWVSNELPFNSPEVVAVIEEFGFFAKNEDYVAGGVASVASTDFRDSPKGLFDSPPQCYLHHQASFIPAFFPEGTLVGEDGDANFFFTPTYADQDLGQPVLGAGTMFAVTQDSPAAQALISFLQTPIAHEIWMAIPDQGFLTPLTTANLDTYENDTRRAQGEILTNATTFRFDASDLMPGGVGAGSFWTGMVDFVGGAEAQTVADQIQASWDALK